MSRVRRVMRCFICGVSLSGIDCGFRCNLARWGVSVIMPGLVLRTVMAEENNQNKENQPFHCGYIAIIGRPNVGKSTLLNQILGEKVAIVSPKPQTTRNRITGIRTTESSQIVFLDTPGIHSGHSLMNRRMVDTALQTLDEVDGVIWLLDAHDKIKQEEERIAETLRGVATPGVI